VEAYLPISPHHPHIFALGRAFLCACSCIWWVCM